MRNIFISEEEIEKNSVIVFIIAENGAMQNIILFFLSAAAGFSQRELFPTERISH